MLDFFRNLTFTLEQASTLAPPIDLLYEFIFWSNVVLLVPTTVAMLYFAWKYRSSVNKATPPYIDGHHTFEWGVSIFVGIIFFTIFLWGLIGFNQIHTPPDGSYEINVIGKQWMWEFQYANGKGTTNDLYAPSGVPVKLIMTSTDVIHSFYIPDFRLKQDVVPGMYTTLWFNAPKPGTYDIYCAEFCGTAHSNMLGKVIILEPEEFKQWLQVGDLKKISLVDAGKKLFENRNCVACHTVNGQKSANGPTVKGLFHQKVTLADGSSITADEGYIHESIVNPTTKVVKGYRPIMPTFKGLLNDGEINAIIAYIKSLKE